MIIAKTMADALQYITADQIEEAREALAEYPGEQISCGSDQECFVLNFE